MYTHVCLYPLSILLALIRMAEGGPIPKSYVYIGHGNETTLPYEERQIVPEGHTIVLFRAPGRPLEGYVAKDIWKTMVDHPDLFHDPITNKKAIEDLLYDKIRIYPAGSRMPPMNYFPFSGMLTPPYDFYTGGIYTIPLPFKDLTYTPTNYIVSQSIIHEKYPGDLNKPIRDALLSLFKGKKDLPLSILNTLEYPIQDALSLTGPGVHYFFNCRYIKGLKMKMTGLIQEAIQELNVIINELIQHTKQMIMKYKSPLTVLEYNPEIEELLGYKKELEEIQNHINRDVPEDYLDKLRGFFLKDSFLEDEGRKTDTGEPNIISPEELQNYLTGEKPEGRTLQFKRKYYQKYKDLFETLRKQINITRRKSINYQTATFPSARRRKSRRTQFSRRKQRRNTRK